MPLESRRVGRQTDNDRRSAKWAKAQFDFNGQWSIRKPATHDPCDDEVVIVAAWATDSFGDEVESHCVIVVISATVLIGCNPQFKKDNEWTM